VRLIPPQYVKPNLKRIKTDAADAEAICEAVARPNMRFVPFDLGPNFYPVMSSLPAAFDVPPRL
jgi:transposase